MSDLKISQLTSGGDITDTDSIPVERGGANYKVYVGTAAARDTGTSGAVVPLLNGSNTHSGASDFTGGLTVSGVAVATISGVQTLTNKTINLSSNTLTGTTAQFNTALSDGDFATLAGTETLTNKTINLSSNTLTGTVAQFNTALSDGDFATLAGIETLSGKQIGIRSSGTGAFDMRVLNTENLTAQRDLTVTLNNANRTVNLSGNLTVSADTTLNHGTYTPTLTNVTNITASTAYVSQWMRVGNIVTVSGRVDIDPNLGGSTASELGVSLPIASNFTGANLNQCNGTFVSNATGQAGAIFSDATNDRAQFLFLATNTANASFSFTFTYVIA